tara:strand:- start:183 stop:401 length:219 start_codon:yes stop_codon:yes gene_type:complete
MKANELKKEAHKNWDKLPIEAQNYIHYLENKNYEYFDFILDIKAKLYNKEYIEAERDIAHVIFNGINVDGYE